MLQSIDVKDKCIYDNFFYATKLVKLFFKSLLWANFSKTEAKLYNGSAAAKSQVCNLLFVCLAIFEALFNCCTMHVSKMHFFYMLAIGDFFNWCEWPLTSFSKQSQVSSESSNSSRSVASRSSRLVSTLRSWHCW